jgi:hypothetical protein
MMAAIRTAADTRQMQWQAAVSHQGGAKERAVNKAQQQHEVVLFVAGYKTAKMAAIRTLQGMWHVTGSACAWLLVEHMLVCWHVD